MDDTRAQLNTLLSGRYRIERELGGGGMGTVFLADDLKHGGHRFLEETRLTASLQHPHILPLFDSGEVGGLPQRTTAGLALGTPDYMAPEQVAADPEIDARADIYPSVPWPTRC